MARLLALLTRRLLIACFLLPLTIQAQEEFSIDVLNVRKGLLSNFVTRTISDDKQFKYFATEAGISRYDGYTFQHYRPAPGSKALANENIETLYHSVRGHIWIGTKSGGLSRLLLNSQELENWNELFQNFTEKPLRIISLTEDSAGHVWVGTWNMGCFKIDVANRKVLEHFPSNSKIYNLLCDSKGIIWYTNGNTLCRYNSKDGSLQRFPQPFSVYNICEDTARKRIWFLGNLESQVRLRYFDQLAGTITEIPTNINARFALSLAVDQQQRIWFGSWGNGLYVSDPGVNTFERINTTMREGYVKNNNHNAILHIYFDSNGIAWLSTSYGGVLIMYPNKGFLHLANNEKTALPDNNVAAIGKTNNNELLLGGISQGLFKLSAGTDKTFSRAGKLPATRINQLYKKNGSEFVATNDGLFYFASGLDQSQLHLFPTEKITTAFLSEKQELWLGTQQSGLWRIPFQNKSDTSGAVHFTENASRPLQVENDRINRILGEESGNIWIATYSGLNYWDQSKQQLYSHRELFGDALPNLIIHDILLDGSTLFLATPNGLYKIKRTQNQPALRIENFFNEENALVNQFICALEKDKNGNIWFSTTTGISKLNNHSGIFHHFGKADGVQINAFHITSSYHDENGQLYFGGDNGLLYFNPETVVTNYQKPSIVLTKLDINNEIVPVAFQYANNIQLDYDNNNFSIQFSSNDFLGTENIGYAYKLEPAQTGWMQLGKKNELNFTGLKAGNYRLLLRANRNNQGWGNVQSLNIQVAYPPWLSWYAWIIYAAMAALIFIGLRKLNLRQKKLKTELQRVQFEKEKEHEVNEAKINFFTNISHEFRTPLTLILSPSIELLAQPDLTSPEIQKISLIKSNAQKLLKLVNQLLDFRKSEHGLLQLRRQRVDLNEVLRGLVRDFEPAAVSKSIQLKAILPESATWMEIDQEQLEMAIGNLISNAIKFTSKQGSVTIKTETENQNTRILVADTGIGIEASDLEKIFTRFYQASNQSHHEGGSGIGLAFAKNIVELHNGTIEALSYPGKGSVFTISIPATDPAPVEKSKTSYHQNNRPLVLLIDDHEGIRRYLNELLKDEYELLEAADGSAGLRLALETIPDLIISDVMMPHMNGIELCSEIKSNIATSHIPVVLLTARASETYELNGLETGADDYITKPFNPLVVKMRVHNMLENRKQLKAYYQKKIRFEPDSTELVADNLDELFLHKAIDLVNNNIQNEALGVEMMVDHLFMSQSTLYRKIKSLTGLSLTGFIRSIRLKKAAQLILQSNMKMNDVAFEVGFNDYKYFKKSFQQQFGCLPSEYREKISQSLQN
ncbi:hybrid sensor histidine kinase/response regulator transcription factor [Flavihumibacter sp. UBA7668]|uniref:hybrid sensor histidine kinase/response regulator transcription factor n=1 Tax=Flavihumibacter sp. UBA7668 TaxID=1946542 RepID=UPI0025C384BE|nr:ATP-binding protein [Flavihumibacter sp. UBA7668]